MGVFLDTGGHPFPKTEHCSVFLFLPKCRRLGKNIILENESWKFENFSMKDQINKNCKKPITIKCDRFLQSCTF